MKACAIIAEYNPFHNGHVWHIQQAKQQTQADVMIAIMSGNFVQRGELAIVDKWQRAEVALKYGIDVVVELPTMSAVQSADFFASQAIKHVQGLQCTHLAFGVEQQNEELLQKIARILQEVNHTTDYTLSYHDMVQHVILQQLGKEASQFMATPNNQLALAYVKAMLQQHVELELALVLREHAQHTELELAHQCIASGSAIRRALQQQQSIKAYVPRQMADYLVCQKGMLHHWWKTLKIIILTKSVQELRLVYQVEEGIEYRLKRAAQQASSYEDFLSQVLTKRFKRARIQRICLYILLNVTKLDMQTYLNQPIDSVRVLGFTARGLAYLKTLQSLEWMTQFKKEHFPQWEKQIQYDRVYNVLTANQYEQNFRRVLGYD